MDVLTFGSSLRREPTYSVAIERRVKPSAPGQETTTTLVRDTIPTLSLANTLLLGLFLDKVKPVQGQATFVELQTKEGLANPGFGGLHAVRHGEFGWGLDCHGCLSLYTVSIVDGQLREMVMYVRRSEVKVEEET